MKEKRSLLALEIGLILSAIAIICPYHYTVASDHLAIKVITIGYALMAFLMAIVVMTGIFRNEKIEPMSRKESLIKELQEEAKKKNAQQYFALVDAQCEQLHEKCALVSKCLYDDFGEDGQAGSIEELVKKYEAVFYNNIDKALTRLRLVDIVKTRKYYGIDDLIKDERWENAKLQRESEFEQEQFHLYLSHIEELHRLCNENGRIINEIEKLLIELTKLNDSNKENDLNELKDYINALQSLNKKMCEDEQLEEIMKKY